MRIRKVVQKPVKLDRDGIHIAGGVDAVINVNVNRGGGDTTSVSRQTARVVQKGKGSRIYTGETTKEVEQ